MPELNIEPPGPGLGLDTGLRNRVESVHNAVHNRDDEGANRGQEDDDENEYELEEEEEEEAGEADDGSNQAGESFREEAKVGCMWIFVVEGNEKKY